MISSFSGGVLLFSYNEAFAIANMKQRLNAFMKRKTCLA